MSYGQNIFRSEFVENLYNTLFKSFVSEINLFYDIVIVCL